MKRIQRATYALITAAALGFSGPIATAEVGQPGPPGDPPDTYPYKFIGGSTFDGTATYGGITVSFSVTINSCGPSGNDCKKTATGYQPKP